MGNAKSRQMFDLPHPIIQKRVAPLLPKDKSLVCSLMDDHTQSLFMASMGFYCRPVSGRFQKICQGAGCLVFDSTRILYSIHIYDIDQQNILHEEDLHFDRIIAIELCNLMLLLVSVDGRAVLFECFREKDVGMIHTIIEDIYNSNKATLETKRKTRD